MAYLFPIGIRVYTEESISLKLEACVNLSTNHRFIYHCIVYSPEWVLSSKDDIKSYNDNYRLVTTVRGQIKILILGLHLEVRWVARSRFFLMKTSRILSPLTSPQATAWTNIYRYLISKGYLRNFCSQKPNQYNRA